MKHELISVRLIFDNGTVIALIIKDLFCDLVFEKTSSQMFLSEQSLIPKLMEYELLEIAIINI